MNFFKGTRERFRRIYNSGEIANLNDNDDIKYIVNKLIKVNEKAIKENNEIIGTIDNNLTEHLINYSNNEDIIDKESHIIEFEKKEQENESLENRNDEREKELDDLRNEKNKLKEENLKLST